MSYYPVQSYLTVQPRRASMDYYTPQRDDDFYIRPIVPSQSGTSSHNPIMLYPTQSLTSPSQYAPRFPYSNYRDATPRSCAHQYASYDNSSSHSPSTYNNDNSYSSSPVLLRHINQPSQPIPVPPSIQTYTGSALTSSSLSSPISASTLVSLGGPSSYGIDNSFPSPTLPPLLMDMSCSSSTSTGSEREESPPQPSSPSNNFSHSSSTQHHHRRHPIHPEGTPQPKGRGARRATKTDDMTKTLACDGCDAMFARKHDLDRHRRIHTLEAPYLCRGCRRSYRRSDARKRHWDQEPACGVLHARNSTDKPIVGSV